MIGFERAIRFGIGLDLDRRMIDLEPLLQRRRQLRGEGVAGIAVGHEQMHCQCGLRRAHWPDVKIVHTLHAALLAQEGPDPFRINAGRRRLQANVHRVPQQTPGADRYNRDDDETGDRVDPGAAGQYDSQPGENHARRHTGVGRHVQERRPDVEVAL